MMTALLALLAVAPEAPTLTTDFIVRFDCVVPGDEHVSRRIVTIDGLAPNSDAHLDELRDGRWVHDQMTMGPIPLAAGPGKVMLNSRIDESGGAHVTAMLGDVFTLDQIDASKPNAKLALMGTMTPGVRQGECTVERPASSANHGTVQ